jgi:hypothetical protein
MFSLVHGPTGVVLTHWQNISLTWDKDKKLKNQYLTNDRNSEAL